MALASSIAQIYSIGKADTHTSDRWTVESRFVIASTANLCAPDFLWESLTHVLHTYTKPYTNSACIKKYHLLSIIYGCLVPLKIEFRKECWFESGQGHHFGLFGVTIL